MIKKCLICDKEFFCKPIHFYNNRAKFCSKECKYISQRRKHLSPELKKKFLEGGIKYWETHKRPTDFGKRIAKIQKGKFREQAHGWKGGKRLDPYGYVRIIIPELRICKDDKKKSKYEFEHRLVMEKHLGRKLKKFECVHHKDGNKTNNNIKNLEILVRQKHFGQITCPHCLEKFLIK